MEKGQRIGEGRTAEVFAWGEHDILKLFRAGWTKEAAAHEAEVAQAVYLAGAPSPALRGLVTVDGRAGIVYERLDGSSLEERLFSEPRSIRQHAQTLAETHAAMLTHTVAGLPGVRDLLERRIRRAAPLPVPAREAALRALDALPDGDTLCHGDFHPANVLLTKRGPVVIDWDNAAHGHPLADVARTLLLLRMAGEYIYDASLASAFSPLSIEQAAARLSAVYLRRYRLLAPFAMRELDAWQLPVAAARLSEGIAEEEARLLALVATLAREYPYQRS